MAKSESSPVTAARGDSPEGSISRRIIEAAAEVFASNGYARTTTRGLATAAGVTEVTLFRHFGSKEKLFAAVVQSYGGATLAAELQTEISGDYRADLQAIGRRFVRIVLERGKIMRMMYAEVEHFPELAKSLALNPRQFRAMLSRYLDGQVERGTIRAINTDAAAQAFWGMILSYGFVSGALKEEMPGDLTPEEAVTQFVDLFVNGTIRKE